MNFLRLTLDGEVHGNFPKPVFVVTDKILYLKPRGTLTDIILVGGTVLRVREKLSKIQRLLDLPKSTFQGVDQ